MISDCREHGHDWRYDSGRDVAEETPRGKRTYGPFRVCRRCLTGHQLADITAGHPESMTAELGDDVEEMLAALDRHLFPRETTR